MLLGRHLTMVAQLARGPQGEDSRVGSSKPTVGSPHLSPPPPWALLVSAPNLPLGGHHFRPLPPAKIKVSANVADNKNMYYKKSNHKESVIIC